MQLFTGCTVLTMAHNQISAPALLDWLSELAPVGILITDADLRITFASNWFEKFLTPRQEEIVGRRLIEIAPELEQRGFDRFYENALAGESRVLSHRFHRYLFPMVPPGGAGGNFSRMQQSATISPWLQEGRVVGTITVIEDVTERVVREDELDRKVQERDALLLRERLAQQLTAENDRLKDHNRILQQEGEELLEANRLRDRFLQQIIVSQEEERKRVARNIHDHLGQELTALRFALSALETDLKEDRDPVDNLGRCKALASAIDSEVGFLSSELRPTGLDDLGLVQTLKYFIDDWSNHFNTKAELHSSGMDEVEMPSSIAINVYRIAQEALNNISKHAKATIANVLIEHQDDTLTLIVEDNGVGFDAGDSSTRNNGHGQMGLVGMKERAALIHGSLEIESQPRRGTTIFLRVPLGTAEPKQQTATQN